MHHYSDDSVARQRLHSTHGFTLLPATEGAHPPMHPESFLHDLGGQHVLPPRSSAVDMSAFTAPSMHPLYDPPPTMYNGPNPLASVPSNPSSTYSWYLPHDLSNDQAVDRDLLCLASPWPSQHQSTTASCVPTSLALSALSTPTNYLDTKPHPPASWMQPHVTSPAATSAPSFATSNRFFTAHHEHVAQPASTYASVTNDAAPPMPSPTQLQGPQGRPPASFHKGVPRSVHTGVGLACAVEPRLSSTSSSADSVDNKKEKRRTQVRDASRRRRAKRKDEETRLRDRIQELMHQIHIMGGPQSVDGVGAGSTIDGASDDAALDAAYQQQLQVVRMLQQKNLQYKEKLAQHEQFARMIQSGIQLLTDDSSATATQLQFLQQQQLTRATASAATPLPPVEPASLTGSAPTNLLATSDLARMLATSSVRDALTKWAKTVAAKCHRDLHVSTWDTRGENVTTNVAMGWQTHVWIPLATSKRREMHVRSHKVVVGANSDECAVKTWEMVTSIAKARRVNPDMKAIELVHEVTPRELIVVVHRRVATQVLGGRDRVTVSVVSKMPPSDQTDPVVSIGVVSFDDGAFARCIAQDEIHDLEPVERFGWSFAPNNAVTFQGWYTVQDNAPAAATASHPDLITTQYSNETMFALVRWESEAMESVL